MQAPAAYGSGRSVAAAVRCGSGGLAAGAAVRPFDKLSAGEPALPSGFGAFCSKVRKRRQNHLSAGPSSE